nr:hypothetical protein [Wadden Sea poxvirus]
MISLFLIICYFILIFNIIIPTISEKMKLEYNAYSNYKKINKKFICVNNKYLFSYDFDISGINAKIAIDDNKEPLHCSYIKNANENKYISCNNNDSNIRGLNRLCLYAYSELFFIT